MTGHHGTFVWADHTDADFQSTGTDQFLIRAAGGVGIGTNAPATQLHVNKAISTTNDAAVRVSFSNSVGSISGIGIEAGNFGTMVTNGTIMAVQASTAINSSGQTGSSMGRLGISTAWNANGIIWGASGGADVSSLSNYGSGNTSFGNGGYFKAYSTSGITLNGTGTYYFGGVMGHLTGAINASSNSIVAGVIGLDENTGTANSFAGYFSGKGYFSGRVGIETKSPNSPLHVNGSIATNVGTVVNSVSLTEWASVTLANAVGISINLPDAAECPGRQYTIKKITSAVGIVTVALNDASDRIDGATSYSLVNQYDFIVVVSDGGNNWYIVGK
jgi:hypothetical protein